MPGAAATIGHVMECTSTAEPSFRHEPGGECGHKLCGPTGLLRYIAECEEDGDTITQTYVYVTDEEDEDSTIKDVLPRFLATALERLLTSGCR
jgi:hypothetical protein